MHSIRKMRNYYKYWAIKRPVWPWKMTKYVEHFLSLLVVAHYVHIMEVKCITNNDNVKNDSFEYFKIEIVILPMTIMNCYRYIRSSSSFRFRHSTFLQSSTFPLAGWECGDKFTAPSFLYASTLWLKSTDTNRCSWRWMPQIESVNLQWYEW